MNPHRVALYYAPPADSPWHAFGSAWLGRDAVVDAALAQPPVQLSGGGSLHELTSDPRRYGFHATLKAPFRLTPPHSLADLDELLATFASWNRPVEIGPLTPSVVDGYVALLPGKEAQTRINALAAKVVKFFEPLRAATDAAELARRRVHPLSARQEELLAQYGYPYVLDEFRFHLTLSNRVDAGQATALIAAATPWVEWLNREPPVIDALTLFAEAAPGASFRALRRAVFEPVHA
jgi:putative phosphonate metabolism protein